MAKFTSFDASLGTKGPISVRAATAKDVGPEAGGLDAISEVLTAQVKANDRVAKRNDIIENARQISVRNAFEMENGPAAVDSDLTQAANMEEAKQASLDSIREQVNGFTGTAEGRQDLAIDLGVKHDAYVASLAKQANSQKVALLDASVLDNTNAFASQAANNPGSWRDILATGSTNLRKSEGAMGNAKLRAAGRTRGQAIMNSAFDVMVTNNNLTGAFDMAQSREYRTLMSVELQRANRVKINTRRNETVRPMTTGEAIVHDYSVIIGSKMPANVKKAALKKITGLARSPREIVADIKKTVKLTVEEETRLLVSLMTGGKINDLGKGEDGDLSAFEKYLDATDQEDSPEARKAFRALPLTQKAAFGGTSLPDKDAKLSTYENFLDATNQKDSPEAKIAFGALSLAEKAAFGGTQLPTGKLSGYARWLNAVSLKDTPANRAIFDKLPENQKAAFGGVNLPVDKIIVPTAMDNAMERGAAFLGQKDGLTEEQTQNAKILGPDVNYGEMTLQQAVQSYAQLNGGAEPTEDWLAKAKKLYPVAEDVAFPSKRINSSAHNIVLTAMADHRDLDAVMLPGDRERVETALQIIGVGVIDPDTSAFIKGTGLTKAYRDFAERFDIAIPATSVAIEGAPTDAELVRGPSDRTPEGQAQGLWANVAKFKGLGQAIQQAVSGLPFTGKPTQEQAQVRDFRVSALGARQNLITAMRAAGSQGRPLSAERQEIADKLGVLLEPAFWANPDSAQVDMTALAHRMADHMEFALNNSRPSKTNTRKERRGELAIANDIQELLDIMAVPPLMTDSTDDIDEINTWRAGTRYYVIIPGEGKRLFEK